MDYEYRTDRLIIRVSGEYDSSDILNFLERNREHFESYEEAKCRDFYTTAYQQRIINAETVSFFDGSFFRYYYSSYDNPGQIIGTVSFKKCSGSNPSTSIVGYKTDYRMWRNGYTYEALSCLIPCILLSGETDRLEALVNPDNLASIALLTKLGFRHISGDTVYKSTPLGNVLHHIYRYS